MKNKILKFFVVGLNFCSRVKSWPIVLKAKKTMGKREEDQNKLIPIKKSRKIIKRAFQEEEYMIINHSLSKILLRLGFNILKDAVHFVFHQMI